MTECSPDIAFLYKYPLAFVEITLVPSKTELVCYFMYAINKFIEIMQSISRSNSSYIIPFPLYIKTVSLIINDVTEFVTCALIKNTKDFPLY